MKKAFTMVELLIVIVILGILSTLVLPDLFGKGEEAKKKITCIKLKGIETALKSFKADNGSYPTTREGLKILLNNSKPDKYKNYSEVPYLAGDTIPEDSWGNEVIYLYNDKSISLLSYGADMAEGGTEFDKDFGLKDCK